MSTVRVDLAYHITFNGEGSGEIISKVVERLSRALVDAVELGGLTDATITCEQQRTAETKTIFDNMSL